MRILPYDEIDLLIQEATKTNSMHYVDHSMSEVHSKIQDALTKDHRRDYNDYDADDYPYVRHVFGDKNSGHVVYHQSGQKYRAPYKMDNSGLGYDVGAPEQVQLAYVPALTSVHEALVDAPLDGVVQIMERFISTGERKQASESDFAGKGRSFPILKPEDVRAALDSIGRAGSGNHPPEELKKRILEIARRKGFAIPKSDQKQESHQREFSDLGDGTVTFQESGAGDERTNALVKIISPGKGSMGFYSAECLKSAVSNGVFNGPIQMFMDHQTKEERMRRPEGDLSRLMAVTRGAAEYQENGPDGEGVYKKAHIYSDFLPFVKERKSDIGISIRAGVVPSGRMVEGVPEVKEMKYLLSADFVTRAGRGGKLVELFESYRGTAPNNGGIQPQSRSNESMTQEEQKQFMMLQESLASSNVRLDRLEEENVNLRASALASEALSTTQLKPRAQDRIRKTVMANLPLTDKKRLDEVKLQESIKAAINDEIAYLQESGVRVMPIVRNQGGTGTTQEPTGEQVLQEAAKLTDESINAILGKEKSA